MAVTRYYRSNPPWAENVAVGQNSFTLEGVNVNIEIKKKDGELFHKGTFESEESFSAFKEVQELSALKIGYAFSGSTKETFDNVVS